MPQSAAAAAGAKEVAGARPASQGAELGAVAKAHLTGALRLVSTETVAEVERFGDPELVAAGKVSILSLERVQHRLGDQWQARKEEVFAFASELLERQLGPRGVHLRVSDTDYFIVHPNVSRLAGQAACLLYLREILRRFRADGEGAVRDILQVSRIGKGRLETHAVDAAKVEALALRASPRSGPGPRLGGFAENGDLASQLVDRWTPFVAADGRTLRISASLEPVYELKSVSRIGFRMIRRVIVVETGEELTARQVAALSAADLLRVDLATITRGLDRLKAEGGRDRQLSLIVPVSFSSLSTPRGRSELVEPVREAAALVRLGVICEVMDIEDVPQSALLAVTSLLKPLSLLVVGRVAQPTARAIARLSAAGFQALSFECPHAAANDAEFLGWAAAAVAAARKAAKSVLVYRAGTMKRAGTLASLGATHVSLDAPGGLAP